MGKVIQFKPPRPQPRLVPREHSGQCARCRHKMDVHIAHPDGSMSCAARGCPCRIRPQVR
ncbi:MAG TPA: hypothetical protein VEC38_13500 [Candidatus Binataceae bacterium]|nr:hypothetical protein [Candidatus Binataceae bacterium]